MKIEDVKEMIACLEDGRSLFYYFKDRYCFDLLCYEMERHQWQTVSAQQLKSHRYAKFLGRTALKKLVANSGHGCITYEDLVFNRPCDQTAFNLSLSCWGNGHRYRDQTTRNKSNLVLQLNFNNQHINRYQQLIKPHRNAHPFTYWGHPVRKDKRCTLAWVRMDVSLETNEVLIEEVQNDWLRRAAWQLTREQRICCEAARERSHALYGMGGDFEDLRRYVEQELAFYREIWSEAALMAAIDFIRHTLGLTRIFYHSFTTGNILKRVCGEPPKSLYTQLPKKFGFERTREPPEFLQSNKTVRRLLKKCSQPEWFYLQV